MEVVFHHTRLILAVGKEREHLSILSQGTFQKIAWGPGQFSNGPDAVAGKFLVCCLSHIEEIRNRQRPDLLMLITAIDDCDGVRLLHIAAKLSEDLIIGHADTDGKT